MEDGGRVTRKSCAIGILLGQAWHLALVELVSVSLVQHCQEGLKIGHCASVRDLCTAFK